MADPESVAFRIAAYEQANGRRLFRRAISFEDEVSLSIADDLLQMARTDTGASLMARRPLIAVLLNVLGRAGVRRLLGSADEVTDHRLLFELRARRYGEMNSPRSVKSRNERRNVVEFGLRVAKLIRAGTKPVVAREQAASELGRPASDRELQRRFAEFRDIMKHRGFVEDPIDFSDPDAMEPTLRLADLEPRPGRPKKT